MLHIITVHWKNSNWIKIQSDYLNRYIKTDFKIVSCLTGIDNSFDHFFDEVIHTGIESHSEKLDLMANEIAKHSDEDDILLFLDGDAFPISEKIDFYIDQLSTYPLVAVQRLENSGDIQPHPSFCLTTVGFWRKNQLTWKAGFEWNNENGLTTDVGAEILQILDHNNYSWLKINRSNSLDSSHRLWFGIYGDCIYHHGAGFRDSISRADRNKIRKTFILKLFKKLNFNWLFDKIYEFKVTQLVHSQNKIKDLIYEQISKNNAYFENSIKVK